MISFIVLFTHKTQKYIPPCLKSVRRRMYKLEVWDWKVACTSFFQRMVQRIQPYILLLSLVTALWLLFYLRFVYEVNFYVTFYWTVHLQVYLPYTQWPLRIWKKMWWSLIAVGHLQDLSNNTSLLRRAWDTFGQF